MEQGINSLIRNKFFLDEIDIKTYSPLSLAYIGDSIYDLTIRTIVVGGGNKSVNKLHASTVKYVSAKAQNKMIKGIFPNLSEEEKDIFRRGKNTKLHSVAKNASQTEYRNATGFEALLGYLYLTEKTDRMFEIIKMGMEMLDEG